MTIMELDQMLTAAANYGFPMLISCYLLVRMENKIDQLSANLDALTRVIAAAKSTQKSPCSQRYGGFCTCLLPLIYSIKIKILPLYIHYCIRCRQLVLLYHCPSKSLAYHRCKSHHHCHAAYQECYPIRQKL